MRPEAPPIYRASLAARLGLQRFVPPAMLMVLRELERRPLRAVMSATGTALATALMLVTTFAFDSMQFMMNVHFGLAQREDVSLQLSEPRSAGILAEFRHLPGVIHAEPFRSVPVELRAGHRSRNTAVLGIPRDATLHVVLTVDLEEVPMPRAGLVLSRKLAEVLGVLPGDRVRMEVLEGRRPVRDVPIARIAETYVGLTAHMELDALCSILGETRTLSGAWLTVDEAALPALHAAVKETPAIGGITARRASLSGMRTILDENLGTSVTISALFSLVMALGMLFNVARITLAERARELASLRVLGFRRREVSAILLLEIGILVTIAVPLGLLAGHGMAAALVASPGFDSEQFRLPLVIAPATYAMAAATVLAAAALSAWNAWRILDRIDIVQVLKARD
jgi:putative ABC transport system permease protein